MLVNGPADLSDVVDPQLFADWSVDLYFVDVIHLELTAKNTLGDLVIRPHHS